MTDRSPLTDPRPGDVVESANRAYERSIVDLTATGSLVYLYSWRIERVTNKEEWKSWCLRNDARVVKTAESEESDADT